MKTKADLKAYVPRIEDSVVQEAAKTILDVIDTPSKQRVITSQLTTVKNRGDVKL